MRTEILSFVGARRRLARVMDLEGGMFACRGFEMTCREEKETVDDRVVVAMEMKWSREKYMIS